MMLEAGAFRQRVACVAEGFEEADEEQLRLTLLIVLERHSKLGAVVKGAFVRRHGVGGA